MKQKKVVLLGSTGSVGRSTLEVARRLPESIEIVALAANTSVEQLAAQAREFHVKHVALSDVSKVDSLRRLLPPDTELHLGAEGLCELAALDIADVVLVAIVGTAGLQPALTAITAAKQLAVASKEILVMAGDIITQMARQKNVAIMPVDSEHNAIFQCLDGHRGGAAEVSRLILTASGGPFRNTPSAQLATVTPEQAMQHPTWNMGPKITIDSATLFNKGLEMIEAKWLFGIDMEKIDVVVHPQSVVHSLVEFCDGSILAQLSRPTMEFPIQYALTWPRRIDGGLEKLDLSQLAKLEFEAPRSDDFPALRLAREAGTTGGTLPAVFNAANEVAVQAFLSGKLGFTGIAPLVERAMQSHSVQAAKQLETVLEADRWAREEVRRYL